VKTSEYGEVASSWSPDGRLLAFIEVDPNKRANIWVLRVGDPKAQPFLRTSFNEGEARFSPDGRGRVRPWSL